jgi:hypothetical protein
LKSDGGHFGLGQIDTLSDNIFGTPAVRHGREGGQPSPAPRVVGLNRNAVDCAPKAGRGCLLAVLGNMNKRLNLSAAWKALDDHLWVR